MKRRRNPYTLTERQKGWLYDQYALGSVKMSPLNFLALTTSNDLHVAVIRAEARKFEEYEAFGQEGETIVPIMLKIDSRGYIDAHEGRHRAAALLTRGEKEVEVWIMPDFEYKTRALKDAVLAGRGDKFIPRYLMGQFNRCLLWDSVTDEIEGVEWPRVSDILVQQKLKMDLLLKRLTK